MKIVLYLLFIPAAWSNDAPIPDRNHFTPKSIVNELWTKNESPRSDTLAHMKSNSFGPNCWNSVLYVSGLVNTIRYVDDSEYWHWMHSKYCQKLPENAKLQNGDIGSVFFSGRLFHSFTRINDDVIFHKKSPDADDLWLYDKFETLYSESYKSQIDYYRCEPRPDDFYSVDAKVSTINEELKQIEVKIMEWIIDKETRRNPQFFESIIQLGRLFDRVSKLNYSHDEQLEFVKTSLLFRISGHLVSDASRSDPEEVLRERKKAYEFFERNR